MRPTGMTTNGFHAQFRERFVDADIPEEIRHDVFLFKFLKARNFDLDRAEKMFRAHLEWRKKWRPEYLRDEWKVPEVLQKYAVSGFIGYDFQGSPVLMSLVGAEDVKGLLSCVPKEDYIQWMIRKLEECRAKMRLDTDDGNLNGPASQFVFIYDLQDWSISCLFSRAVVEVARALAQIHEANYPEHLRRIYFLNMPRLFSMALNLVKQFIGPDTREKFVFLGGKEEYAPVLTAAIAAEFLPEFWGGTRVDEDGDPRCPKLIGKGGKVPKSFYRTKYAKEAEEEADDEANGLDGGRQAAILQDRRAVRLECQVEHPGSILSWEFSTEAGGVKYSVLRLKGGAKGHRVREPEWVDSHLRAVSGEVVLREAGLYCLQLRSKLASDKLSYLLLASPLDRL